MPALSAALVLVGGGPIRARAVATGAVLPEGPRSPAEVRNFYAGSDVVVVPSVPTRDFREPWGLVVNEAFNQGVPVIATDAVGAVAGGLVAPRAHRPRRPRRGRDALAAALRRMHDDPALRARLGAAATRGGRRPTRTTRGPPACQRALAGRGRRAVASVEAHGSSADAQRADPAARCPHGERGRPREDPARVPGRPHHRRLHAGRSSATRARTSRPTSTSTPTAVTCSRAPRSPAAGGGGGGGTGGGGGRAAPGGVQPGGGSGEPLLRRQQGASRTRSTRRSPTAPQGTDVGGQRHHPRRHRARAPTPRATASHHPAHRPRSCSGSARRPLAGPAAAPTCHRSPAALAPAAAPRHACRRGAARRRDTRRRSSASRLVLAAVAFAADGRPAARAHDVDRDRRSCCSAPRSCVAALLPRARAERAARRADAARRSPRWPRFTALSIIWSLVARRLVAGGQPHVRLPGGVRRRARARAARARPLGGGARRRRARLRGRVRRGRC